ncbi:hypothetical protein BTVI_38760 [Pitangus sulphuratus]|nr:hypothetical protein BTVI_38760 [Pitangus sulphuratus]
MRNKKEELKALAQSQKFDITGISETWWDESCDWSALLDGYRLCRKDMQGRRGRGVALRVIEGLECMELTVGNGTVENSGVDLGTKVEIGGHLGHSHHGVIEFKISADRRKSASKTSALDMRRADFRLFRKLARCAIQGYSIPYGGNITVLAYSRFWSITELIQKHILVTQFLL